ncbi:MAG: sensor histidine kinase [Desulfococcaceae bacterium]
MNRTKWFYHPVFVFIFSIVALAASLALYIYWYVKVSTGLDALVRKFNIDSDQVFQAETWVVILVLSILVAIILIGIFTIFVYNQKNLQLYRLQHNFINNFTHELKTPVTSLKLYLETFLKHEIPREEQIKYIRYMLHDTQRLSENISRILNLARIESKNYSEEFSETDLPNFIRMFYENNRHLFGNSDVRISGDTDRPVFCSIIIPMFEMLLMNLLTNSITYNKSETPRVSIRFERMNRKLHIFFEDNGIGFEKKERKKIFRKFYQIGRSENMTAKGSGLGLYLVQNIARIHKGKIFADSPGPGKGAVFTLILPYNKPYNAN